MNGYERTVRFVKGEAVDRPPFMPLVIEWVSRTQGIAYPDFVYDPEIRAQAYERCVEQYDLDCVLPDADFYEQLEDFGAKPVYDGKGYSAAPIIEDVEDLSHLTLPEYSQGSRMGNRLEILRRVAAKEKGKRYIFGICIGPLTEFCNARTTEEAMCDLLSEEEAAQKAIDIFFENGMRFIEAQLEAGADGIQIVEPCCSLISPELYARLILPYHKKMVDRIQRDGGFARLHICGDTNGLIPYTLSTGTHILDVDSAVDMGKAAAQLGPQQVLCGNLDPTVDVLSGKPEDFGEKVRRIYQQTGNRTIMAAGCDVPPDTPEENVRAFYQACVNLER
ncbi:uroporphyrinogen decarboxylase family protein [Bianquea renquensis]|uniref:Uroporphyrinogen decarboxylase family protein n=1 Tax=Bianquea renquensis TaxID=2763661 RepID=A0A926DTJ4_9FIRM|nr:uroporphyrinogen decarboxylase family protein [Bianquea renquensis]MBC8544396.1 uroporphyrinogen decarboxylase family protein [Bianquea renquensis]